VEPAEYNNATVPNANTYFAQPFAGAPKSRWYPENIRMPETIEEGEAALALIDQCSLGAQRARARQIENGAAETRSVDNLIGSWGKKRAEVAYVIERIRAGESRDSVELAKAREIIASLEKTIRERNAEVSTTPDNKRMENLSRQVRALELKCARLKVQLAEKRVAGDAAAEAEETNTTEENH